MFKANESYWNKDNINVKTLTWLYNDGSDPTKAYKDTVSGVLSGAGLNTNAVESAIADGLFDDYAYVSLTNGTSYMAWTNLHREALVNFNDGVTAASTKTEEQVDRFNAAILNQHFRMALAYGMDRASYNEQSVGATLRLNAVRNSYTPGTFVTLDEEVTVDINGTATTFPAGTFYGEIMQAQLDADGIALMVWNGTPPSASTAGTTPRMLLLRWLWLSKSWLLWVWRSPLRTPSTLTSPTTPLLRS